MLYKVKDILMGCHQCRKHFDVVRCLGSQIKVGNITSKKPLRKKVQ